MRKRLSLTTAALLAGVTFAATQCTSNSNQQGAAPTESKQGQAQQSPSNRNTSGATREGVPQPESQASRQREGQQSPSNRTTGQASQDVARQNQSQGEALQRRDEGRIENRRERETQGQVQEGRAVGLSQNTVREVQMRLNRRVSAWANLTG